MPVELKMPALSPTMEKGTIARWLLQVGDSVKPGDLIAEVETEKATMEVEAVDEGFLVAILVPDGTDDVPVGTPIAIIGEEAMDAAPAAVPAPPPAPTPAQPKEQVRPEADLSVSVPAVVPAESARPAIVNRDSRIKATPLARRIAAAQGIDLATIAGSGPAGRIVKADLGIAPRPLSPKAIAPQAGSVAAPVAADLTAQREIPHEEVRLSSMRKTIARRLSASKQQIPHIYLTLDARLDALLALRGQINATLEQSGLKVSVNDMLIKALALSLIKVPSCNVSFAGESLLRYSRADISVAVSIPDGLITPVVREAESKSLSAIASEMKSLAALARDGRLKPEDYQGGTASLSNLGMFGIKQFDAVINPPQAMILAVGAGDQRPVVVDGQLAIATMMSVTGSFDHRAIDGADAALLMQAFKGLVEEPLRLLA